MPTATADREWIQTYTGKKFFPLAPRVEDVDVVDIAHALSNKCRFSGHCLSFYSVAEHSVRGAEVLKGQGTVRLALAFLLHDASEAYLPDLVTPIKGRFLVAEIDGDTLRAETIRAYEEELQAVIGEKFGLNLLDFEAVKPVDLQMLATEKRDLLLPTHQWNLDPAYPAFSEQIRPWEPRRAREEFLDLYHDLTFTLKPPPTDW